MEAREVNTMVGYHSIHTSAIFRKKPLQSSFRILPHDEQGILQQAVVKVGTDGDTINNLALENHPTASLLTWLQEGNHPK